MKVESYFRPESVNEAVELKRRYGDAARFLAGGSDLMVVRPAGVRVVIDIRHSGLNGVHTGPEGTRIGGAALLRDVEASLPAVAGGMLAEAASETAPWLIRNSATPSGNLANASPAADLVPMLIALDAVLLLFGTQEEQVAVEDVLVGPHHTTLGDRLITAILISPEAGARHATFIKHSRSKSDIAQANVAVAFRQDGGVLHDVRIVLGAVGPTAMRARGAEAMLDGQQPTPELLRRIQEAVSEEVRPISDWRASEGYRRRVAGIIARRAVERAWRWEGQG